MNHKLGGMKRTDDGRYYGTCACGSEQIPTADKDYAWQLAADHFVRTDDFQDMLRSYEARRN